VYYSNESGRSEVYVVSFPKPSEKWQLSSTGGSLPHWRSDGREVIYVGRDNRLMAVSLAARA
jgi:Tol biopolymer transport system component